MNNMAITRIHRYVIIKYAFNRVIPARKCSAPNNHKHRNYKLLATPDERSSYIIDIYEAFRFNGTWDFLYLFAATFLWRTTSWRRCSFLSSTPWQQPHIITMFYLFLLLPMVKKPESDYVWFHGVGH